MPIVESTRKVSLGADQARVVGALVAAHAPGVQHTEQHQGTAEDMDGQRCNTAYLHQG